MYSGRICRPSDGPVRRRSGETGLQFDQILLGVEQAIDMIDAQPVTQPSSRKRNIIP